MNDQISRQKLIDKLKHWHLTNTEHGVTWLPEHFVAEAIEALSQPPADQWIPCSERLPEKDGRYLCFWGVTVMQVFQFSHDLNKVDDYDFADRKGKAGFYDYDSEWGYFEIDYVSAWMPLPEPYKEVE